MSNIFKVLLLGCLRVALFTNLKQQANFLFSHYRYYNWNTQKKKTVTLVRNLKSIKSDDMIIFNEQTVG